MVTMRGTSRATLEAARERLTGGDAGSREGDELFAVAALLDAQPTLRRLLTDPGRAGDERVALVGGLLRGRISATAFAVVEQAVRGAWARPRDLADAVEHLGVVAHVVQAERDGTLDDVEDELFRFGRLVAGARELRDALSDHRVPAEHRRRLVTGLLEGRASQVTVRLVDQAVAGPRGLSLAAALETFAKVAADWRNRLIATVRSAVPLTVEQRERLSATLARQYGHGIRLNLVVEPELIGGVRVEIGDEVVEGTVSARLDEARRRMAG